jgi:hypothetical protein
MSERINAELEKFKKDLEDSMASRNLQKSYALVDYYFKAKFPCVLTLENAVKDSINGKYENYLKDLNISRARPYDELNESINQNLIELGYREGMAKIGATGSANLYDAIKKIKDQKPRAKKRY